MKPIRGTNKLESGSGEYSRKHSRLQARSASEYPDIGEIKLHVCGTNGAMVICEARPEISVYYKDQPIGEFRNRRIADQNNLLLADHFANVLEFDEPSILDVRAGRDIAAIVDACLRSAESQQVEAVQRC